MNDHRDFIADVCDAAALSVLLLLAMVAVVTPLVEWLR